METNFALKALAGFELSASNLVVSGTANVNGKFQGKILRLVDEGKFRIEGGDALVEEAKLKGGELRLINGRLLLSDFDMPVAGEMTRVNAMALTASELTDKPAVLQIDGRQLEVLGTANVKFSF